MGLVFSGNRSSQLVVTRGYERANCPTYHIYATAECLNVLGWCDALGLLSTIGRRLRCDRRCHKVVPSDLHSRKLARARVELLVPREGVLGTIKLNFPHRCPHRRPQAPRTTIDRQCSADAPLSRRGASTHFSPLSTWRHSSERGTPAPSSAARQTLNSTKCT